jgi:hypothetical protein
MTLGDKARRSGMYDVLEPAYSKVQILRWRRAGEQLPAPSTVKRMILKQYAIDFGLDTLVETGTYKADTVRALRDHFETIYSIELFPELYQKAAYRCRKQANAVVLQGDSAEVLPSVLEQLKRPALFWLDAHYSGTGTGMGDVLAPIVRELELVLQHDVRGHVVLIDDARDFNHSAETGYPPATVLSDAALQHGYSITERYDIFSLIPDKQAGR